MPEPKFYEMFAAVGVALVAATASWGQAAPGAAVAPGASGRIEVPLLPAGQEQSKQNPVVVSFTGKLYKSATFGNATGRLPAEMTPEDSVLPRIMADNASGEVGRILANWNAPEREEIAKMVSDNNLLAGNTAAYRKIAQSELLAKIYYGANYVIYLVRHIRSDTSYVKDYSFQRVEGKLYLTNSLMSDAVFQFITTKYAQQLGGPKKEQEAIRQP